MPLYCATPLPQQANVVFGKWIFKHKVRVDGSFERYKAGCVLRGFTQHPGIDYAETFSPVVMPATPIHQLDIKNAFLHGTPIEQPSGFEDPAHPGYVCRLNNLCMDSSRHPVSVFCTSNAPWNAFVGVCINM
ncbi:hypothetical protein U9M48_031615 [Paspalum notatum var. saurae]|uniref:Reverse transcriptase Ty1/copia-type domain-containing protein n=1 Tax=Paspalum notatum var. saurae TaxID=547442 RepID=A0AAQ3U649_PASNO